MFQSVKVIMKLSLTKDPNTARRWRNGPIPASLVRDSDHERCLRSGQGGILLIISILRENMSLMLCYAVLCYER